MKIFIPLSEMLLVYYLVLCDHVHIHIIILINHKNIIFSVEYNSYTYIIIFICIHILFTYISFCSYNFI